MIAMPLRHRSLGFCAKVSLGSFIAMAWVLILGGVGLLFTERVTEVSLSLVEGQAVPMLEVGNVEKTAWEIYLRGILHAGLSDPAEMEPLAEEIKALSAQLDNQLGAYGKHEDVPQAWLASLRNAWATFQATAAQSLSLSRDYAKEDAMQLLVLEGRKAFAGILSVTGGEQSRRWQKMTALRRDAENTRAQAILWVGGVTLVFGCLVLGGWFYTRKVNVSLKGVTSDLASSITQMTVTLSEQERITAQQASSVNETNATMEALGASARQMAEQADTAANGAQGALDFAEEGSVRVEETVRSMENAKEQVGAIAQQILLLSGQMGQIREITDMVSDFANETKMLAMNAAVEAVRAGEHGKGFSVLAVETRKLADESKRSAGQIRDLVGNIQKATNTVVMAVDEGEKAWQIGIVTAQNTSKTFHALGGAIGAASEGSKQISANVRQQSVAVRQVVEAMQSINIGAKESALGISQVKSSIQVLNESAQTLRKMV